MAKSKQVSGRSVPAPEKRPRVAPQGFRGERVRISFQMLDDRNWPLHKAKTQHLKPILRKLAHLETLTVEQAYSTQVLGDYQDLKKCPNKRVLERMPEQYDVLTKVVIQPSGALRLFAIRQANVLNILWWDPKHEVWPEGQIRR